ncbi:MFS transporter [Streptomyces bathyalis]|uniref:MFS transporter n=1 Tax=Streptomyces bathyalis TaxID=2710756 RepID=A0A7T1T8J9_9ACTN|nr:MFS transporter [Streptomyces bathyalis]QPP08370.1 MFS transporter [Streptomyces bathyalis]
MATPATATGDRRSGYGALLRTPGAWRFLIPGFLARQPIAMLGVGTVLLVEHTTGSYGAAGIVIALSGVSMALLAPQGGKLTDRFGQGAVLVPLVLLHALSVSALIVLALREAPLWTLFAAAVPAGATIPQISPMVRARWSACLSGRGGSEGLDGSEGPDGSEGRKGKGGSGDADGTSGRDDRGAPSLVTTAAAFESVTDEFSFVVGPVLATALCTGVHPAAGLAAEVALMLGSGLLFAAQRGTQPEVRPGARRRGGRAGSATGEGSGGDATGGEGGVHSALGVRGVRVLIAALLGIGTVFGGMQVSVAAFTQSAGAPELNGVLYGVFAAGNMSAALAVGTVHWRRSADVRLLIAYPVLVLAALAMAVTAQLTPWLPLVGGLGLVLGLWVAPSMITGFTLVELLVPAAFRTEAFTWLTGAVALGQASGSMAAGQLTDAAGAGAGFFAPLAGTGLALAALVVFRRRLAIRPGDRSSGGGVGHRPPVPVD